ASWRTTHKHWVNEPFFIVLKCNRVTYVNGAQATLNSDREKSAKAKEVNMFTKYVSYWDRMGISASGLCVAHCLIR
ncbi:MAG: hypothetical protein ABIT92_05290, partial [Gammaproteobacteria bacterium]